MMLIDVSLNARLDFTSDGHSPKVRAIKALRDALGTDLRGARGLLDDLLAADTDGVRVRLSAEQYAMLQIALENNPESAVWMFDAEVVGQPLRLRDFSANGVRA